MAFVDIDAVIAYVPGSMQKRCHYSLYLVQSRKEGKGPGMGIVTILSNQWFEREHWSEREPR